MALATLQPLSGKSEEVWKDRVPNGIVVTERRADGSYLTTVRQEGTLDGWEVPTFLEQSEDAELLRRIARQTHIGTVMLARGVQTYGTAS
jgi:hypothetical protein